MENQPVSGYFPGKIVICHGYVGLQECIRNWIASPMTWQSCSLKQAGFFSWFELLVVFFCRFSSGILGDEIHKMLDPMEMNPVDQQKNKNAQRQPKKKLT